MFVAVNMFSYTFPGLSKRSDMGHAYLCSCLRLPAVYPGSHSQIYLRFVLLVRGSGVRGFVPSTVLRCLHSPQQHIRRACWFYHWTFSQNRGGRKVLKFLPTNQVSILQRCLWSVVPL